MTALLALTALIVPAVHAADPAALVYEYRGPTGEGDKTVDELLALVRENPRAEHLVRGPGARDWTPWNQVPELAQAWIEADHGAGGKPPRNAPPDTSGGEARAGELPVAEPADTAPDPATERGADATPEPDSAAKPDAATSTATAPDAPTSRKPVTDFVHLGGDVRLGFVAGNLERLGGSDAPAASFVVTRARPILDVTLGKWLTGRLAIEARQDDSTTTYGTGELAVDVRDWAEGWSIQGREVWLAAHAGGERARHEVRIGLQEPAFGVRDTYEERYPFGGDQRADLARRTGLIAAEDLGVGWRGELGGTAERPLWAFDFQVLNGSGNARLDQNTGKDFVARAAVAPGELVAVSLSGLFGARAADASGNQAQGQLAVELTGARQRLLVEALAGVTTEDRLDTAYTGAGASGAWEIPVESAVLDGVTAVGRVHYYDPVFGWDAPDGWWAYAAGGWVVWEVPAGQVVRTGVTWEMSVPQDLALPVTHEVIAEAAWRF